MPGTVVSWLGRGAVGRGQELVALGHPTAQAEQGRAGGVGRCTRIGVQVLPRGRETRK